MSFEKGDKVVLDDKHSEHDGEVGEVTQVSETMFGGENYTVSFEEGQEAGLPEESLDPADEVDGDDGEADEQSEAQAE